MWAPVAAIAQTKGTTVGRGTSLAIRTKTALMTTTTSTPWAKAKGIATGGREKSTDTRRHKNTDTRRHKNIGTRHRKDTSTLHHRTSTEEEVEATGTTRIKVVSKAGEVQAVTAVVAKGAPAQGAVADTAQIKTEVSGRTRIEALAQMGVRVNAPTPRKGLAGVAALMDGLQQHRMLAREANFEAWIMTSSTNGSAKQFWKRNSEMRGHRQVPLQRIGGSMSRKTTNRPCCGASTGRSNISSPNRRDE